MTTEKMVVAPKRRTRSEVQELVEEFMSKRFHGYAFIKQPFNVRRISCWSRHALTGNCHVRKMKQPERRGMPL
jgi:hypothetical protein